MARHTILLIESGKLGGGSFESLYQHVQLLAKDNYRPVVVFFNENRFIPLLQQLGVVVWLVVDPCYTVGYSRPYLRLLKYIQSRLLRHTPKLGIAFERVLHWSSIREIKQIIARENVELIHLNDQINRDFFVLLVVKSLGLRCISHLRSTSGANFLVEKARYANVQVDAYIANSVATRCYWEEKGLDSEKMHVIYNCLSQPPLPASDDSKLVDIAKKSSFVIGCVGSLEPRKGHAYLLHAFSRFKKLQPKAVLVVVGKGPLREKIEAQIKKLGMIGSVKLLGYQQDAQDLISAFDVLVVPSREEGFGRVIFEAMQVETPVVATRVGGIPETVSDGLNGLLVDYGDEQGLCEALNVICEQPEMRKRLVKNGKRFVEERFGRERYMSEIENVYRRVL